MEETIRTLGVLNARHFSASLDSVRLRTGRITERIKIDHPEAAAIVAFADRDRILMVRQWRYALGAETLEIPAGKMDPGEPADTCAGRELFEETGYRAGRMMRFSATSGNRICKRDYKDIPGRRFGESVREAGRRRNIAG